MRSGFPFKAGFSVWGAGLLFWSLVTGAALAQQSWSPVQAPAPEAVGVLAVRVAFQPDDSPYTSGTGQFEDAVYPDLPPLRLDAEPHDSLFLDAKLQFASNYVRRASGGKTATVPAIYPGIITAPGQMADYAPIGPQANSDVELQKMVALYDDIWAQIDPSLLGRALPQPLILVLFHAGVGRDIELTGTTLDRTPADLPSLTLSRSRIEQINSTAAVLQQKGPLAVSHVSLWPRLATRAGTDPITEDRYLIELSTNGLVAAGLLNAMGAPDLYNTETGASAIGPYGLMDPYGIFAWHGLLPPEPSAWTKLYLGWSDPEVVLPEVVEQRLLRGNEDDVWLVRASASTFFLVEYRVRDLASDGLLMSFQDAMGRPFLHRSAVGDTSFTPFVLTGLPSGRLVDVDDGDWALPGGVDDEGIVRNGGYLVWHIDERNIVRALDTNRLNVDPLHRAVDVEEADGGPDLGYPPRSIFAPEYDRGTPFDFFFEGNPTRVVGPTGAETFRYSNRFGPDTYPASTHAVGGPTFVSIGGFNEGIDVVLAPSDGWSVEAISGASRAWYQGYLDATGEFGVVSQSDGYLERTGQAKERINGEFWPVFGAPPISVIAIGFVSNKPTQLQAIHNRGAQGLATHVLPTPRDRYVFDKAYHAWQATDQSLVTRWVDSDGRRAIARYALTDAGWTLEEVLEAYDYLVIDAGNIGVLTRDGLLWSDPQGNDIFVPAADSLSRLYGLSSDAFGVMAWVAAGTVWVVSTDGEVTNVDLSAAAVFHGIMRDPETSDVLIVTTRGQEVRLLSRSGHLMYMTTWSSDTDLAQAIILNAIHLGLSDLSGNYQEFELEGGFIKPRSPIFSVGAADGFNVVAQGRSRLLSTDAGWMLHVTCESCLDVPGLQGLNGALGGRHLSDVLLAEPGASHVSSDVYVWPHPVRTEGFLRVISDRKMASVSFEIVDAVGQSRWKESPDMSHVRSIADLTIPREIPSGVYTVLLRVTMVDGTVRRQTESLVVIR